MVFYFTHVLSSTRITPNCTYRNQKLVFFPLCKGTYGFYILRKTHTFYSEYIGETIFLPIRCCILPWCNTNNIYRFEDTIPSISRTNNSTYSATKIIRIIYGGKRGVAEQRFNIYAWSSFPMVYERQHLSNFCAFSLPAKCKVAKRQYIKFKRAWLPVRFSLLCLVVARLRALLFVFSTKIFIQNRSPIPIP